MRKEDKQLIHFYKQVASLIIKSENKRVSLSQLESKFPKWKDAIFSWMQWTDAKEWFNRGIYEDGLSYILRAEYADLTYAEMITVMNKHYGLYQD